MAARVNVLILCVLLAAVVFSLYSVELGHNFLFDEESIVLNNPYLKDPALWPRLLQSGYFYVEGRTQDLWLLRYRPLASLLFAWDYSIWKGNPLGYNLTNVFLHIGVCLLFFWLLVKIFQNAWIAFLGTLLYSVHPLHTEAVTNLASRGDLLGAVAMLGALHSYWSGRLKMSVLFYGMAFLSKESYLLVPAYLFLLDVSFIKNKKSELVKKLAPFALVAFVYLIYRKFFCEVPFGPGTIDIRESLLRFFSMGKPFLDYLQALLTPEAFKLYLLIDFAKSFLDPKVFLTVFGLALLLASWLLTVRHRGTAFFGLSLFLASFLPFTQVIHYAPEWAEHYLYVPAMGLAVLLGCLFRDLLRYRRPVFVAVFLMTTVFFLSFFCYRTWQRNSVYVDKQKFFITFSQSDSPYAFFAYRNLGQLAMEKGDFSQARVYFQTALAIDPGQPATYFALADWHLRKAQTPEALAYLRKALELDKDNNVYRLQIGRLLIRLGRLDEAIQIFEEAQQRQPSSSGVYLELAGAYELKGDFKKADQKLSEALALAAGRDFESAKILLEKARFAYRNQEDAAAVSDLRQLLERYPDIPWYAEVAKLLLKRQDPARFMSVVESRYEGFESSAHRYVLMAFVLKGDLKSAGEYYERHKDFFIEIGESDALFEKEQKRAGVHEA